jgi:hypothetical protein
MDNSWSIEIVFALFCGFAWGALVVTAITKFFANVSGGPPWSITGVFISLSIIGFMITACVFFVGVETG